MSSIASPLGSAHRTPRRVAPLAQRPAFALLCGGILALVLTLPKAWQVWSTGIFLDPDDAMRAVEVRDFLGGQAWFDLVPHRLSPDHPFVMHWSRLIDMPLAAMAWGFARVLSPEAAELAMRLLAPSLLCVAALWLVVGLVRDLIGPRAMLPAALLLAGSGDVVASYIPGHIHHHAAQLTLLLAATRVLLRGLDGGRPFRDAAGAALLAVISLGIGLQNLPFVVGFAAIVAVVWVRRGVAARPLVAGFGAGFTVSALVVFAVDVPPWAYGTGACDAFSTAHLLAAVIGGAGCLLLAAAAPRMATIGHRYAAVALVGLAVLGALRLLYPACLHDPMAGVDPILRDAWLANVGEALPLLRLMAVDPGSGVALALTLACGLTATIVALRAAPPQRQACWAALLLLGLIGLVGTAYQVRVAGSACVFLVPGVVWSTLRLHDRLATRPGQPALLAAVLLGVCGNGAAWAALSGPATRLVLPSHAPGLGIATQAPDPAACYDPSIYAPLAAQTPGLVLSTIDPGSTIMATTAHAVLAAPYHRNSYGNRVALMAFAIPPAAARPLVMDARATYVALCRASNEALDTAARHPDSLAAALLAGRPPDWLVPIGTGHEAVLLYRVVSG